MDLERAFKRMLALHERLKRAEQFDFTEPEITEFYDKSRCPGAAYGQHSAPDWRNCCTYCGKNLGPKSRLRTGGIPSYLTPDDEWVPRINPITLEPSTDWPYNL